MRRCIARLCALLLVFTLVACGGTLEVGVERTPTRMPRPELALGWLAYVQGGDIWVRELPDGEPRRLTADGNNASPRWSPSGEWLLFQQGLELWAMAADGSNARALPAVSSPDQVAWSPVEDLLAYTTLGGRLMVVDTDGAVHSRPPQAGAPPEKAERVERFAWHPGGEWLACQVVQWADVNEDRPPARQILRLVRADGQESTDLFVEGAPMETTIRLAGWSGDGTHVLFWRGPASASIQADGAELVSLPAGGGQTRTLAPVMLTYDDFVVARPLSDQLALVVGSGRETWLQKQLVVVDAAGQSARTVSDVSQAVAWPAWSPDGEWIAYASMPVLKGEAGGERAIAALGERCIWAARGDATGRRQLTDGPAYRDERPLWSADGQHILFARIQEQQVSLWLMGSDGSQLQQVVKEISPAPAVPFGVYGHVEWQQLFDWWTGLIQVPELSLSVPTAAMDVNCSEAGDAGLVYLEEEIVYLLSQRGACPIGPLPGDAGYLTLGAHYLAYVSRNQVWTFSLADGTSRALFEFPNRPGQDLSLRWSRDGSALAYAVAWEESDGSRMVELGTTDGYRQTVVETLVARPAGPTPTPPPEPPVPPEPGFAMLEILGFDRLAGRLVVMPVGGIEGKSRMWAYDVRRRERLWEQPWPTAVSPPTVPVLSPDLAWLAASTGTPLAVSGMLQVYRTDRIGVDRTYVELPTGTHATWLSWSPDSQRLAYLLNEGAAPGLDVSPSLGLWVWEAETGQVRQVASVISPEAALHGWTADGQALVLQTLCGISRRVTVSLIDVTDGEATLIPLPEGGRVLGWLGNALD
jgi:hypothetical protein